MGKGMLVNGQHRSVAQRHENTLIYLTNIEFLLCAGYRMRLAGEAGTGDRDKGWNGYKDK